MKLKIAFMALLFCLLIPCMAEALVSIVGGLSHEKGAKPGEVYRGIIFLQNPGEEPQEVKLYQPDYIFFCDGTNIYGEPGENPRSNAKWITFSPERVVIQPKDRTEVHYTVRLPDDKALVGTYWSMIMVEGIGKSSPEAEAAKPLTDKPKAVVRTVVRYGIQMVTNIGNIGTRKLKFLETKLLKEDDEKKILQVDVENVGERFLRPSLWTELYDEKGNYIGRFEGARLRTYPSTSVRFRIDLSTVPKGKYKALVVADCGGDDLFGATYDLVFQERESL